jgi:N-acetylmuramoyl-L-alanine amidase
MSKVFFKHANQISVYLFCIFLSSQLFAASKVVTRVWPADEYTRITIESNERIENNQSILKNPDRIVLDLKNTILNNDLKELSKQNFNNEQSVIKSIRVAQFDQKIVRIVVDLKNEAKTKIFNLEPIKPYGYRLVLDIYNHEDEIASLIKQLIQDTKEVKLTQVEPNSKSISNKNESTKSLSSESSSIQNESVMPETNSIDKDIKANDDPVSEKIIVAIDAGHGGEDPGARGSKGTREKDITLIIAKQLKEEIDKEPKLKGILIRDGDYFIPLAKRVSKARKIQADIFISIHADAFTKKSVKGSSVFALSERGATSAFAKFIANKENESDLIGGVSIDDKHPDLAKTLLDLSQSATINDSIKLAGFVLEEVGKVNTLHKQYVEQAGFAVLKAPDIPSILVETAFISNPTEEESLKTKSFQIKLSQSILSGLKKYLNSGANLAFYTEKR